MMNLLIKSISISLLSLIGVQTACAKPNFGRDIGRAAYAGDQVELYDVTPQSVHRSHEAASWAGDDKERADVHGKMMDARAEEGKLNPEQRRALRREIREAGHELDRQR